MSQAWTPDSSGGFLANDTLSREIRHAMQPMMRFRQFTRPEPGFGKGKGEKVLFNRISNVATGGGDIAELSQMPEDSVTISQGECVVGEKGNSIPYTGKLEALAEYDVANIFQTALKNDMAKTLDSAAGAEFKTAPVKYVPTGTSGTPTSTFETTLATAATRDIQAFDVKEIVDALKSTYTVDPYDGNNYIGIVSQKFARALMDDSDWEDAAKYGDPERLFAGEAGRYYGARIIVETNELANVLGTTEFNGEAVFFGADPMVEAVAIPEELRSKIPTDYGRDQGVAWYFLGGWSLTYDSSTAGELKVIHVTST